MLFSGNTSTHRNDNESTTTHPKCLKYWSVEMDDECPPGQVLEGEEGGCPQMWDTLLCWPATPTATLAIQPCFHELHGILYDRTQNASRWCGSNGTWATYADYSQCRDLHELPDAPGVEAALTIYYVGYALSLTALIAAVIVLLHYKRLRCLRNKIHVNLMCSYILADIMWIAMATIQITIHPGGASCIILVLLLNYFHLTNFFWMFIEGLYLYLSVVKTFAGNDIHLRIYGLMGWGSPFIIVAAWGIAKSFVSVEPDTQEGHCSEPLLRHCPWMHEDFCDWIHMAPTIALLVANLCFLFRIMWVLITKLRSANSAETMQYRKGAKALLILMPLLGVAYILMIRGPSEGVSAYIFNCALALMLSTQGLMVALFFCFCNSEVQGTLRHRAHNWRTSYNLGTRRGNRRTTVISGTAASPDEFSEKEQSLAEKCETNGGTVLPLLKGSNVAV